jgi:Cu2+-exporting ATPase
VPWQILHWQAGRVRVRWWRLWESVAIADRLTTLLAMTPGIASVRVTRSAASITITYHPAVLPDQIMRSRLDQWFATAEAQLLREAESSRPEIRDAQGGNADRMGVGAGYVPSSGETHPPAGQGTDDGDEREGELTHTLVALGTAAIAQWRLLPRWQLPFWQWTATIALVRAIAPVVRRAWSSLIQDRRFNIDCLDLMALALGSGGRSTLGPAWILSLHALGDTIRNRTARSTTARQTTLSEAIGRFAWRKVGEDAPVRVAVETLQAGDVVIVYPGEQIPVDGCVVLGEAVVDESSLTGESMPVVRQLGGWVYASTLVRSGRLGIQAERVGEQTRAAASLALLTQAPVYDTRMGNYAEQLANRALLPSVVVALGLWAITRDPARAAAILTLDFVTGIRLSIPTAFLGALNHTTSHGILVRSGRTLEQLAQVDTIVFDKTGTLTAGTLAIADITPVTAKRTAAQLLQLAASAEQRLTHPLAEAIVRQATEQGLTLGDRSAWDFQVGQGVWAIVDQQRVLVGSAAFLREHGVPMPPTHDPMITTLSVVDSQQTEPDAEEQGRSQVYIAIDQEFCGILHYCDPLRPESADLVREIQQDLGLEVHLLTGDIQDRAMVVAHNLGIPAHQVYAAAFPENKAEIIRDLRRSGRTVAFVGDGLNDSVALAYADVSISLEQGSEIARETADVVLMNNHLIDVLEVLAIARHTQTLITQNTALVVLPNLLALGWTATRGLSPPIAALIHNGTAILASLNSLRPLIQHHLFDRSSN